MKAAKSILILALIGATQLNAQEAFKGMSVGIETGTTGIGLQISLPVVTDHLTFTAGFNYFDFTLKKAPQFDISSAVSGVNGYVEDANRLLSQYGRSERLTALPQTIKPEMTGLVRNSTAKAMLEYYPAADKGFHFSIGMLIGGNAPVSGTVDLNNEWNIYSRDRAILDNLTEEAGIDLAVGFPEVMASVNGRTFKAVGGEPLVRFETAKVRPYFGLGFGQSVPDSNFGIQAEIGACYLGKAAVNAYDGVEEIPYNESAQSFNYALPDINWFRFYPVLTIKMIIRLF